MMKKLFWKYIVDEDMMVEYNEFIVCNETMWRVDND